MNKRKKIEQLEKAAMKKEMKQLRKASKPAIKLLKKMHPHMTLVITSNSVQLMEGVLGVFVE